MFKKILSLIAVLAISPCALGVPVSAEEYQYRQIVIPTDSNNADASYLVENTAQANERFRICNGEGTLVYKFDLTQYDRPKFHIAVGYNYRITYSVDGGQTYETLADYQETSGVRATDTTNQNIQTISYNRCRDAETLHIKIQSCTPNETEYGGYVKKIIVRHRVPAGEPMTDNAPHYTYGDLNGDGTLNASDALQVLQESVHLIDFTEEQRLIADVNMDGASNAADALTILQKSVSLLDQVPAQLKQDAFLHQYDRVVFIGDSTTDHARDRENFYGLEGIGYGAYADGYVKRIHDEAVWEFNTLAPFETINRGIAGIRSTEYKESLWSNCCELAPDVVSIMLGINDTWRRYDSNFPTTTEQYEKNMRTILDNCLEVGAKIILLAPFAVPGSSVDVSTWHEEDLNAKIAVCQKLAEEYGTLYIDTNQLLNELQIQNPDIPYTADGVHPSGEGCEAIAAEWLKTVKKAGVYLYE